MGKQSRAVRVCEHVGGDAAEEDLAQSRMTLGAHDQEIGTLGRCGIKQ